MEKKVKHHKHFWDKELRGTAPVDPRSQWACELYRLLSLYCTIHSVIYLIHYEKALYRKNIERITMRKGGRARWYAE
jgi:hypothetical protein